MPPDEDPFERGVELFNRRAYFECHQLWEEIWRSAADERERRFLEALIQVAAALHLRFERGAGRGARNLLYRALLVLEDYRPQHRGIDVARLHAEVELYAERVELRKELPAGWLDRWLAPRIHRVRP
jgi:predicted metal-dependent hydrolase